MPTPIHRTSTIKKRLISRADLQCRLACHDFAYCSDHVVRDPKGGGLSIAENRFPGTVAVAANVSFSLTSRTFNSYDCRRSDAAANIALIFVLAGPLPCAASNPATEFETERCPTGFVAFPSHRSRLVGIEFV